ncbi:alpha/beta hydrolase fold domain-containing protein [Tenacibaculum sp. M341]|uniref:alpha/beta hydrolase fold domain-containing protein n=1 Tax=Tenacibaculum sp. M341 TaxID=2530339 RepID=UPI0010480375|nr:alpha/beta hydrolase [Tenacibaculum sp. M341]TCI90766.1 steryl acetyl hydrolase [Tenacibaculum sp. M341]
MKKSLSYHLVSFVLKLKGIKKMFSTDPVDYKKIRKEDVKIPKSSFFKKQKRFTVLDTTVTEVLSKEGTNKLILFIHGGAFISGPAEHHWNTIRKLHKHTVYTIWLCDYPKAPESQIDVISNNIDAVYKKALESYQPENIVLLGDSVGGTLSFALVQRLIKNQKEIPSKIIAISPVMDATLSNPRIMEFDKKDPMLSKKGILSAKKMCANNKDLTDLKISPIYGSFNGFPKTLLFLGENDIMYPDQEILVEKLKESSITFRAIVGKQMPHIWVLLPFLKEGKIALKELLKELN